MALLEDYSKLMNPTNLPSADPNSPGGIGGGGVGLEPVTPKSFLPATNYDAAPPGSQHVTPTLVNFNPKNLPAGYQPQNVPEDWQTVIASSPDYMNWQLGAQKTADDATAARKAALRSLAVRFGGMPENFSDVYGDIDPETAALAKNNPESENARLLRSYTDQVEQTRRQLASRGMLQSGEFGYTQDQLDLARQGDVYNLNNQFLDQAQGAVNTYGGVVGGLNADQIDQIRAAAQKIQADKLYQAQIAGMNPWGGGRTGNTGNNGNNGNDGNDGTTPPGTTTDPYKPDYVTPPTDPSWYQSGAYGSHTAISTGNVAKAGLVPMGGYGGNVNTFVDPSTGQIVDKYGKPI